MTRLAVIQYSLLELITKNKHQLSSLSCGLLTGS